MADDELLKIIQGDSPVIDVPERLDGEALKPAAESDLLKMLAASEDTKPTPIKRPVGRPKGSTNKVRPPGEASRIVTPPRAPDTRSTEEKVAAKKKAAEEWAKRISGDFNEIIMTTLVSVGVPAQLIYIEPPEIKVVNNNYTPFANMISVNQMQAHVWGRLIAEIEATDIGQKISGGVQGGSSGIIIYGVLSAVLALQYIKTVQEVVKTMKPWLDAYKAAQQNPIPAQEAQQNG